MTNAYQLVNIRIVIQKLMAAKNIGGERKAGLGGAFSAFPGICPKMARKIPFRLIGAPALRDPANLIWADPSAVDDG